MSEQVGKEIAKTSGNGIQQALMAQSSAHPAVKGLAELPIGKQLGIMLGLAFSVAIGVAIVLWSQESTYARLYSEIGEKDAAEILEVLNTQGIKYKVETGSGAILVPPDKVNEIKLKLAGMGLPKTNAVGFELLSKDQGFGASKSLEMVRFQRALEGEIAQTIMSIQSVKSAKVLLAIPQQSVFVRERKKPSASVVVNLYQGRSLDKGQIESIIHLVASSVPQLEADQVTVVDQKGQLLNSKDGSSLSYLTSKQFDYKKNVEEHLMERIENIMSPLVGDGMRVQVSADIDFTETDKTQELFDPKSTVLRSEQTSEEINKQPGAQGVPGALSNQPPAAGTAPQTATPPAAPANGAANPAASSNAAATDTATATGSTAKNATRNFEVDKTITHTRSATGLLRRLSVAVVVDDQRIVQADGKVTNQPYKPEDITRFTDLVKQAVGFDNARGDQVTVSNVAFKAPDAIEALPAIPLWEQPWFLNLVKQLGALLVVLIILFGVLRPTMRHLAGGTLLKKGAKADVEEAVRTATGELVANPEGGPAMAALGSPQQGQAALPFSIDELLADNTNVPQHYGQRLEYLQGMVDENPQLVAQVLKRWVR